MKNCGTQGWGSFAVREPEARSHLCHQKVMRPWPSFYICMPRFACKWHYRWLRGIVMVWLWNFPSVSSVWASVSQLTSFWDPWRCVATVGLWWLESAPLWVPSLLPGLGIRDATTDQPTPTATPSLLKDRTLWTELQEMSPTLSCFPWVTCLRVNPRSLGPEAVWG